MDANELGNLLERVHQHGGPLNWYDGWPRTHSDRPRGVDQVNEDHMVGVLKRDLIEKHGYFVLTMGGRDLWEARIYVAWPEPHIDDPRIRQEGASELGALIVAWIAAAESGWFG